jgi:hypothetical protein
VPDPLTRPTRDGDRVADVDVSALAINVTVPADLQWHDTRRGEEFVLTSLNPERPVLAALIEAAASRAAELWSAHRGLP